MENLGKKYGERIMIDQSFWESKKVFVTGNTGFKGSWLTMWLTSLGADVKGYSLKPPTNPSLFELCHLERISNTVIADIRDRDTLARQMQEFNPDIVIHMAAQPLVRESYANPVETYEINVMGTVNVLEAVRKCDNVRAVVNVTTDKCYDNKEWVLGYRESEPMGGYDPYSNSKACSELVTSSYRNSFFNINNYSQHGVALATARAGNVIGGGDWAEDRLIPDCIRALLDRREIVVRNPHAVRPWQHVLEPLNGYLLLAKKLYTDGVKYAEGWNFGPDEGDAKSVEWVVKYICNKWSKNAAYRLDETNHPHEANYLKLDISKAKYILNWQPRWSIEVAIDKIVEWVIAYKNEKNIREVCFLQLEDYTKNN